MADHFQPEEWQRINEKLDETPDRYGFPERRDGSVLLGSFNIRKLGDPENRTDGDWEFLARTCAQFDLLAVQEIMSGLGGLRRLQQELERVDDDEKESFNVVVSDETGAFAGERGLRERLGFIYRWPVVQRREMASDLTYDRAKMFKTIVDHKTEFIAALEACSGAGKFQPPCFVSFVRQPYCVEFEVPSGQHPYLFTVVNAHLVFSGGVKARRQEFKALTDLLKSRLGNDDSINLILMGDLNLDFDNPETDRSRIDEEIKDRPDADTHIKRLNADLTPTGSHINFPFLDQHKGRDEVFRTNARRSQTYDHFGLFAHDRRLPTYDQNEQMPQTPEGPDYGVFDFMQLFSEAIYGKAWNELTDEERKSLWAKAEHSVSDHLPLWLRLPLTA